MFAAACFSGDEADPEAVIQTPINQRLIDQTQISSSAWVVLRTRPGTMNNTHTHSQRNKMDDFQSKAEVFHQDKMNLASPQSELQTHKTFLQVEFGSSDQDHLSWWWRSYLVPWMQIEYFIDVN